MRQKKKQPSSNSIARMAFVAVALLIQVSWILLRILWLNCLILLLPHLYCRIP